MIFKIKKNGIATADNTAYTLQANALALPHLAQIPSATSFVRGMLYAITGSLRFKVKRGAQYGN
jgi:hypothetical protein